MSNTIAFLTSIAVLLLASLCAGVISYSNALGAQPLLEGYMGFLVPVALGLILYVAGVLGGASYGGDV